VLLVLIFTKLLFTLTCSVGSSQSSLSYSVWLLGPSTQGIGDFFVYMWGRNKVIHWSLCYRWLCMCCGQATDADHQRLAGNSSHHLDPLSAHSSSEVVDEYGEGDGGKQGVVKSLLDSVFGGGKGKAAAYVSVSGSNLSDGSTLGNNRDNSFGDNVFDSEGKKRDLHSPSISREPLTVGNPIHQASSPGRSASRNQQHSSSPARRTNMLPSLSAALSGMAANSPTTPKNGRQSQRSLLHSYSMDDSSSHLNGDGTGDFGESGQSVLEAEDYSNSRSTMQLLASTTSSGSGSSSTNRQPPRSPGLRAKRTNTANPSSSAGGGGGGGGGMFRINDSDSESDEENDEVTIDFDHVIDDSTEDDTAV
jgi:hypothetical protein